MKKSVVRKQIQTRYIGQLRTVFFKTIHISIVRLCVIAAILLVFRQEDEVCACEQVSMDGVSASSVEPVYPVLIRSEHAPLLRVVVEVEQGTSVEVKSFVITLNGTDDENDLESLSVFSCGDANEFSALAPFGEVAMPAATVHFQGAQILKPGKNVWWVAGCVKPTANLAHRISAQCSSIQTTAGTLTPHNNSPHQGGHRIGVAIGKHNDDGVHTYRIPALAADKRWHCKAD